MQPKGKLIPVGGSLRFEPTGILKKILDEMKGNNSKVEIITTASEIPEEVGPLYVKAFQDLGCKEVSIIPIKQREDVFNQENFDRIAAADGLFMTGGDQMKLTSVFGGSDLLKLITDRYWNDSFVIAGTSAGAMAMTSTMIYPTSDSDIFLKNEIKFFGGLSFIKNVVIDTHFFNRGRFWRLSQVVTGNPGYIGIGLCEDTGVIISEGNIIRNIGNGQILLIDGHEISHSNIAETEENSPLSIEHIIVHILSGENTYHLKERKFYAN